MSAIVNGSLLHKIHGVPLSLQKCTCALKRGYAGGGGGGFPHGSSAITHFLPPGLLNSETSEQQRSILRTFSERHA